MRPIFSLLVPTGNGNILWECLSAVTREAVAAIQAKGGIERIIISHPHFYAAMGEWSDALGGVPILLHEADRQWIQRPHPAIEHWSGDEDVLKVIRRVLGAADTLVSKDFVGYVKKFVKRG